MFDHYIDSNGNRVDILSCETCKHFNQLYIKSGDEFIEQLGGYCTRHCRIVHTLDSPLRDICGCHSRSDPYDET